MSERPPGKGTRTQQHEIVIDAPLEAVWKAITDAEELTRWFVEEASVEPGVGGTIASSWGGDERGKAESTNGSRTGSCGSRSCRSRWAQRNTTVRRRWSTSTQSSAATARRCCGWSAPASPTRRSGTASTTALTADGTLSSARCGTISNITAAGRDNEIKVISQLSGSPEDTWARLVAAVEPTAHHRLEHAPTILEVNIPELGNAYPGALDVVLRSEQLRLYDAVGLRQDAGRGRHDPREMAAVARAGAGRRGTQPGLTERFRSGHYRRWR